MKNYDIRWDNNKHLEALERRRMKELDREKRTSSRYWSKDEEEEASKDIELSNQKRTNKTGEIKNEIK